MDPSGAVTCSDAAGGKGGGSSDGVRCTVCVGEGTVPSTRVASVSEAPLAAAGDAPSCLGMRAVR